MREIKVTVILIITLILGLGASVFAESTTAVKTIQEFYKSYLNYGHSKIPNTPRPEIGLSKAFRDEIRSNADICAKYVDGPCGWGADGDEYLDAQETDPKLNYMNSGITVTEIKPDIVQVKLNVYPSIKDAKGYYDKKILFTMVKEKGVWVVDDVMYSSGVSTRKRLAEESAYAIAHPDPEAVRKSKNK